MGGGSSSSGGLSGADEAGDEGHRCQEGQAGHSEANGADPPTAAAATPKAQNRKKQV